MLFGLLKRKFFAIEQHDEDAATSPSTSGSEACSPRKRLRVEERASINEASPHSSQTACAAGNIEQGQVVNETSEDQRKEERVRALRAQLKEFEERIDAVKKQTAQQVAMLKELREETMGCMVCKDPIQNPQILQCGHTACYPCLRAWWTRPLPVDKARMVDTVAESDLDDEDTTTNNPNQADANPPPAPRTRRRHHFHSVALRMKHYEVLVVGPAPVHHPDPILNNIAQAQFWRRVAEAMTRREKEREEADQDGRRTGIRETTQQIQREDALRQAPRPAPRPEMPRPLNELVFGGGNPPLPPAVGAVDGAIPGFPLLVPVAQAPVPHPLVAPNNQPI